MKALFTVYCACPEDPPELHPDVELLVIVAPGLLIVPATVETHELLAEVVPVGEGEGIHDILT